ncbi:metal ABC transporter permease [Endozoicomonas sp. 8E]|uniref:metal ABC transporter permease n=1 Tax=Endozoicomonas sp. 8E TaxID=3035692 RepID=UPI0029395308|nr:metal ABC transporter permease [Endozoicomonas sp. 8E]WOG28133.1 metal ABC transporter permease [Endozoicomonas sp. 8E]
MMEWALFSIMMPALVAGIIVFSTHLVLGRQVLKRGIVFMDLAIAQIAAMGAIVAHILTMTPAHSHGGPHDSSSGLGALMPFVFSIGGAGLIAWLAKYTEKELEAIIGCIYVVSAASITLLMSSDPHGAEHISKALNGHILWLGWQDMVVPGLASLAFLALTVVRPKILDGSLFYPLFALMVTLSVKMVGVYLVFSALIMPALAVNQLSGKKALTFGYMAGLTGMILGLVLSSLYDFPGGATVVVSLTAVCVLFRVLSRR